MDATSSLLSNAQCTPAKAQSWVDGFRTLYCSISPYLGISQLEQISGVRVFLSGPHDRQPNWKANTFGHYNPAFVTWASANLLPEKTTAAQQAYDRLGRIPARVLLLAYARLKSNTGELNGLANRYRGGSAANLSAYYQDNLDRDPDIKAVMASSETSSYIFPTTMGFWARREADGTMAIFYGALQKTLERFDADFLRRRDPGNAEARSSASGSFKPRLVAEQAGNVNNVKAEGEFAPIQNMGCIPLTEVRNTSTPPDLYKGVTACFALNNYDRAVRLFALGGVYASFDAERITDKTAGQAKSVLVTNTLLNEPEDKKAKFAEAFNRVAKNPELLAKMCGELQRVGMPNYHPTYMILHGMRAITGNPNEGALVKEFDPPGTWKKVHTAYLNCPETVADAPVDADKLFNDTASSKECPGTMNLLTRNLCRQNYKTKLCDQFDAYGKASICPLNKPGTGGPG